jgi:hypothetical protein
MYNAVLHLPDDVKPEGDLEELGVVVHAPAEPFDNVDDEVLDIEGVAGKRPVDFEFIPLEGGRYGWSELADEDDPDDDVLLKLVHERAQTAAGKTCEEVPHWNDDAYGFVIDNNPRKTFGMEG